MENAEDLLSGVRVEIAGGFIADEKLRVCDERSCDGDALLLAAGELLGEVVGPFGDADEFEGGEGLPFALLATETGEEKR